MSHKLEVFNIMASDIGITPISHEIEKMFYCRVAYTAARFWLSASCIDDGAGGFKGITKQAMNWRLKTWTNGLDHIYPGINEWFEADGKGIPALYNRLIDIGDLAQNGFGDTFRATLPTKVDLSSQTSCITGFYDPTIGKPLASKLDEKQTVVSGLLTLVKSDNAPKASSEPWWTKDRDYLRWEKITDYEDVRFVNPKTKFWNIQYSGIWTDKPFWIDDLALASMERMNGQPLYFLASKTNGRIYLAELESIHLAQELFFHHRYRLGNQARIKYKMLDNDHAITKIATSLLTGNNARIVDAVSWPFENAADGTNKIIRAEAIPLARELLMSNDIRFEEDVNGRK